MKRTTSKLPNVFTATLRTLILFALLYLNNGLAFAQNLIPNPSFEVRDSCPSGWHEGFPYVSSGSLFATNWFMPNPGTSDYFSTCAPNPAIPGSLWVSVPENMFGYQQPKTGQAYAGGILYSLGNESIETPLLTPTIANHRYYIGYWINMADNSVGACSRFGAYASTDSIELQMGTVLDMFTPQVESPAGNLFMDSIGWEKVAGMYTSQGNEKWLTIGSFRSINDQDTVYFQEDLGFGYGYIYYFYDDVCMLDLNGIPNDFAVIDTTLCGSSSISFSGRPSDNYYWSNGSEEAFLDVSSPGVYWVNSVDLNTCTFTSDTFRIDNASTASPIITADNNTLCNNQTITLSVAEGSFSSYLWNTGSTAASIKVTEPGIYSVTAFSSCNAKEDAITISVSSDCNCIFVPNAFSPNNDGTNDNFTISQHCAIGSFALSIYNRFGEKVFYSDRISNAWNGTFKGFNCDQGTYFCHVQYQLSNSADNGIKEYKGDISLIR